MEIMKRRETEGMLRNGERKMWPYYFLLKMGNVGEFLNIVVVISLVKKWGNRLIVQHRKSIANIKIVKGRIQSRELSHFNFQRQFLSLIVIFPFCCFFLFYMPFVTLNKLRTIMCPFADHFSHLWRNHRSNLPCCWLFMATPQLFSNCFIFCEC